MFLHIFPFTYTPPIDPAPVPANEIAYWDYSELFSARSDPISDGARSISVAGFGPVQSP